MAFADRIAVQNTYTVDEIVEILKSGRFDPLVGLAEDVKIEAKGEPYQLSGSDRQKQELAKDVSALANSCGGIVLIGFRTTKSSLTSVEEIECCRPFEASLFAAEQYRNVLQDWIHPSIHSVQIDYYASLIEPGKGVAAIVVPPEAPTNKPYVLARVVGQEGKLHGTLIGYFERVLDRIPPTSVGTLRSYIKDGMRFGEFSERLTAIETTLAKLLPAAGLATDQPLGNQTNKETNPAEQLTQRTVEAESAVERTGQPNFILAAAPMSQSNLPQLFESQAAPVVRLLEHPPILREEGFVIRVPKQSSIIKGELRRCVIEGYKIIDLWHDGTLVAVGPGDYDFLCWARQPRENVGLPIRNFVLAETTFNFVQLASEISRQAEPPPTRLKFLLSLKNMSVNGLPCALSSERDNIRFPRAGGTKTVPDSTITSEYEVPFDEWDVGRVVYELLARVYAFFGFNHSDMPYVNDDDPKRVTPKSMFISLDSTP